MQDIYLYSVYEYREVPNIGLVLCFSCFLDREIAIKYSTREDEETAKEKWSFYSAKKIGGTLTQWLKKSYELELDRCSFEEMRSLLRLLIHRGCDELGIQEKQCYKYSVEDLSPGQYCSSCRLKYLLKKRFMEREEREKSYGAKIFF